MAICFFYVAIGPAESQNQHGDEDEEERHGIVFECSISSLRVRKAQCYNYSINTTEKSKKNARPGPKNQKTIAKPLLNIRTHDQERQRADPTTPPCYNPSLPRRDERCRASKTPSCLPVSQLDIPKCCYSFLPQESCVSAFCGNRCLTNETPLPPISSHCFRQTGLGRAVCSLSCTTVVRSRVMAGFGIAVFGGAFLLFVVCLMFML